MAVTKIWPIKDSVQRVVEYAKNPEKTEYADIQAVLHYAGNEDKTTIGTEKTMYVTGVNCSRDRAFQEMLAVQKRFDKVGGNVAYHAYQSFKTGEVTPELCHKLGVELAKKMWGDEYQVLIATHFNTGTYHNHFVVNAVNLWDGKKFLCNKGTYFRFRALSDELCAENNLTVIKNPKGKTPRNIYFAEKNGEPTRHNLMREAIDFAISVSVGRQDFLKVMRNQGYEIELNRKYPTIRSMHSEKATRMFRLGEEYEPQRIWERIRQRDSIEKFGASNRYWDERTAARRTQPRRCFVKVSLKNAKKITGLRALYLHYCYLLGAIPKNKNRRPLSPEMREAWRQIDKVSAEVRLIGKEKLNDLAAVDGFIEASKGEIEAVTAQRNKLYNQLRRCTDPERITELKSKRDDCTTVLKELRKDIQTAERIVERNPKMKEEIAIEEQMRQELRPPLKTRKRGYIR